MCDNATRFSSQRFRRLMMTIAIAACGVISIPTANGGFANNVVLVPPADLPELARQTGEAMFLQESSDGRALLYIERNQGTRLAILDVTEPTHVKSEGYVQLDAPDAFDFVSNLGNGAILVQFRRRHRNAVLYLHNARLPTLQLVQGPPLQSPILRLGNDGYTLTSQVDNAQHRRHPVADNANLPDVVRLLDIKRIRETITDEDTGTTFLLAENGLYLIRRPAVEWHMRSRLASAGG